MDLLYLWRALLRKKWLILFFAIASAVATFVLVGLKKDLYESVAQYSTGFTTEKVKLTDGSVAVDVYTLDIKFNNVIETFRSPRVIGMLSYKLMLHDLEQPSRPFKRLTEQERKKREYTAVKPAAVINTLKNKVASATLLSPAVAEEQRILDYLKLHQYDYASIRKTLVIRRVDRTDYLDVVFRSENPEQSAYVVNTLSQDFINYYKNLNNVRNTESAESIQQLLTIQQQKVDSLTNELKIARISQGALDPVEQTKNAMNTEKELQMELASAQSDYNLQAKLYDSYTERIATLQASGAAGTSGPEALELIKRRDELREELEKSSSPDAEQSRQLAQIEQRIKNGGGNDKNKTRDAITDLETKASEAKARMQASAQTVSQLSRAITAAKSKGSISPKSQVEIEAIERQLDLENTGLKNIKEKMGKAEGLIKDNPTANFTQTLLGEPNPEPMPKHRLLYTVLAGVATFVVVALLFLLANIFDGSLRRPSQFTSSVNLKLKSVINNINLKKQMLADVMLEAQDDKKAFAEKQFRNNIRKLRYEMDETGKKLFLITSTQKGTGKTVVAQSLAYSFLRSNKTVLLIDLNFQNNALTDQFHPEKMIEDMAHKTVVETAPVEAFAEAEYEEAANESGTTETHNAYLGLELQTKSMEVERIGIGSVVQDQTHQNLYLIGCRMGNNSPAEVLEPFFLKYLFTQAKKQFDYVIVEAAAMNDRPDSYELFRFTDCVITVFSAGMNLTQADTNAVEKLNELGPKNFGAVFNKVHPQHINM